MKLNLSPLPANTVLCSKCGADVSNDHCHCDLDQQEINCAKHTAAIVDRDVLEDIYYQQSLQQNPDGSWTPAECIPYKYDHRTFWQKVAAVIMVAFSLLGDETYEP